MTFNKLLSVKPIIFDKKICVKYCKGCFHWCNIFQACRLPLFEYLAERMCSLCYDRAWYAKLGGCIAVSFLYERMSIRWVYQHLLVFVKAQLFVMMDLTGEVKL